MDEKVLPLNQVSCDTSNLSLDRDPAGTNTNSHEIQRGYAHFSATLYLEGLGINGRIILKLILMKWGGRDWTEFS
jgi:hypothetical protein